ncbi:hypothetical protein B0J14DRAFT_637504 [Halenospora varia]|nr:hypothetical protein B0J14DRAFT_637504 [Halenospora varia]
MSAIQIVPHYNPSSYENVFNIPAPTARNIFTAIFICLNTSIVFIGGRLIKRQAQRKLLKVIRISCVFSQGLVTKHNNGTLDPVPEWPAAQLAFSARDAALVNGGVSGIWQTVNANTSAFAPSESDVLGRWICDEREPSLMTPADWANMSTLEAFNRKTGYHFSESSGYAGAILNNGRGPWTSIFVYSADQFDNSTSLKLWDMKATMIRDLGSVAKNATNFQCRLNITDPTWQPTRMPAKKSLDAWDQVIVGSFAEIEPEEYGTALATNLNMMSLIAGSGNSKTWNSTEAISRAAPAAYGCLYGVTVIYKQVFAIALVLILLVFIMGVVDLYDIARNKWDKRHKRVEAIPVELLNWQLAMVQKMIKNEGLTERQMNELEFYWDQTTEDYACRPRDKKGTSHTYEAVENPIGPSTASNSKSNITISTNEVFNEKASR